MQTSAFRRQFSTEIHRRQHKLEVLLKTMGYIERGGVFRHPSRQAIFVGDFIDRGPRQLRAVDIARRMADAGAARAVMGNHELNAIAWHTPDGRGDYLRPHFSDKWGSKNYHQHVAFLREVDQRPRLHREIIDWFMTLPLWLELDGIRVVHACWHGRFMEALKPLLTDAMQLKDGLLADATTEPADAKEKDTADFSIFKAVEALTKGIEIPLPAGHSFKDKDDHQRYRVRVRWWAHEAIDYRSAAMLDDEARQQLPAEFIPAHARIEPNTDKPVFFGHYWLTGDPCVLSDEAVCVDYSAGKGGPLVAYRWAGESVLTDRHFVRTGG
ncbi:MAG: metallophosphoesterase [Rhodocyclaceae bacterium]|nr:metallophosphoesterase [Rhodocyclaceae bacterium]MBX3666855.1 metallophosphoesterase [Rhodocyclaceae bacterium]